MPIHKTEVLKGGVGYRKYQGDALWLPNTNRPVWLDGSLPGVKSNTRSMILN